MTQDNLTPVVHYYKNLESTNNKLKELIENSELPEFTIVITPNQTSGKGQMGSSWESEEGCNLTFSILLIPQFIKPQNQFYISKIVVLAICDTLAYLNILPMIKWPNDVYVGDMKIAGILIENTVMGNRIDASVVGIGLNVNQTVFTSNAKNPVSIRSITGQKQDIEGILNELTNQLYKWYQKLQDVTLKQIDDLYFERLYRKDGYHLYEDEKGTFEGKVVSIEPSGLLVLKDKKGVVRKYAFKEVEFL